MYELPFICSFVIQPPTNLYLVIYAGLGVGYATTEDHKLSCLTVSGVKRRRKFSPTQLDNFREQKLVTVLSSSRTSANILMGFGQIRLYIPTV